MYAYLAMHTVVKCIFRAKKYLTNLKMNWDDE